MLPRAFWDASIIMTDKLGKARVWYQFDITQSAVNRQEDSDQKNPALARRAAESAGYWCGNLKTMP